MSSFCASSRDCVLIQQLRRHRRIEGRTGSITRFPGRLVIKFEVNYSLITWLRQIKRDRTFVRSREN